MERKGLIVFKGRDVTIVGPDIVVGQMAPEFEVHNQDWEVVRGLASTENKVRIIAAVHSLDTDVCDRETRRFNQDAARLSKDIRVLVISMDLPYAQKRWCGAAGIDQVIVLSDHVYADFGEKYGTLMKEPRLERRAVFVVDRDGIVRYADYMPVLGQEPHYDEVLQAAVAAL
jgi:thiol peroxidase